MAGFRRKFDAASGRITWQTVDESGDTFSLTLGPTDAHDGLYVHIQSNGETIFEYSLTGI